MVSQETVAGMLNDLRVEMTTKFSNEVAKWDANLSEVKADVYSIKDSIKDPTSVGGREKKFSITDQRGFNMVPNFTGKEEDYEEWRFKLLAFLGKEGAEWRDLIILIEAIPIMPTDAELDALWNAVQARHPESDMAKMNTELYSVLSLNLKEKP